MLRATTEYTSRYTTTHAGPQGSSQACPGHSRIVDKICLVSGGESDRNRFEIKPWIESNALDIVQTDCNVTGLSENWFIARMAHVRGKYHCPHNWHGGLTTIANAHLVASSPSRHMLELNQTYNPLKEEIFKDPLVVEKGTWICPTVPVTAWN